MGSLWDLSKKAQQLPQELLGFIEPYNYQPDPCSVWYLDAILCFPVHSWRFMGGKSPCRHNARCLYIGSCFLYVPNLAARAQIQESPRRCFNIIRGQGDLAEIQPFL